VIYRSLFTDHLLAELASFALPVGDNDAPDEPHGWQGEPNENLANFIPWLVVAPGQATRSQGTFADPQETWQLPYFVSSAGISRKQTENVADRVRRAFKALAKVNVTLKDETWRLMYVHVTGIGGVNRIGGTNPAYHVQTDTFEFWLSKEN
jgi:hypothetical protein